MPVQPYRTPEEWARLIAEDQRAAARPPAPRQMIVTTGAGTASSPRSLTPPAQLRAPFGRSVIEEKTFFLRYLADTAMARYRLGCNNPAQIMVA